jgi:large subunit ribosomal protein L23
MRYARDVIIAPVVSEKSYGLMDEGRYTKQAVESIFGVKVRSVNTMNRKGKAKRFGLVMGQRKDQKRAIVTLAPGEEIDIFSGGI